MLRIRAFLLFLILMALLSCKALQFAAPAALETSPAAPALGTPTLGTPNLGTPTRTPSLTPAAPASSPTAPATPTQPPPTPSPTQTTPPTPAPTGSPFQQPVFEKIWSIVNEDYLYPDFNGLDWNAVYQEFQAKIAAGLSDEAFYAAMDEMIDRLGDEHSNYFSPEEAQKIDAEYSGSYDYVGIGVMTTFLEDDQQVSIISLFADSPAERAGLKIHDVLLEIDDQPLVDSEGPHPEHLRGPEGSSITLRVQTPGEAPRTMELQRAAIDSGLRLPYEVLITPGGKRIGYVLLVTFNDQTIDDKLGRALAAMSAEATLDGLIIDNRYNGGGASDVLEDSLAYFTDGKLGFFVDRQGKRPLQVRGIDVRGSSRLPLVVMVGPGTASFGEIFAGVLKDKGRALLVGETTGGNVEVLSIYKFQDGSRAWIARETFRPFNQPDANWEESGIAPDITMPAPWNLYTLANDPAIQAALAHFDA